MKGLLNKKQSYQLKQNSTAKLAQLQRISYA